MTLITIASFRRYWICFWSPLIVKMIMYYHDRHRLFQGIFDMILIGTDCLDDISPDHRRWLFMWYLIMYMWFVTQLWPLYRSLISFTVTGKGPCRNKIPRCPNIGCAAVWIPRRCRLRIYIPHNGGVCESCPWDKCRQGEPQHCPQIRCGAPNFPRRCRLQTHSYYQSRLCAACVINKCIL